MCLSTNFVFSVTFRRTNGRVDFGLIRLFVSILPRSIDSVTRSFQATTKPSPLCSVSSFLRLGRFLVYQPAPDRTTSATEYLKTDWSWSSFFLFVSSLFFFLLQRKHVPLRKPIHLWIDTSAYILNKNQQKKENRSRIAPLSCIFAVSSNRHLKKKLHAPASLSDEKTKAVWRSQFLIFLSIRIVVSLFLLFSLVRYTR